MLGEREQIDELAAKHGVDVILANVVQTLDEAELIATLPEFDGWIAGDDPATRNVLAAGRAGKLKAVLKWGVGVDNVDRDACADLGLGFDHTPGMFSNEVADLALAYTIMLARHIAEIDQAVKAGQWPKPQGISLAGKTAGLVGFGNIGSQIARRLDVCGLQTMVYDPYIDPDKDDRIRVWPIGAEQWDFLIFACSLNADNRHILDDRVLRECKHGLRVVNVARGPLIDERALAAALDDGRVRSVALDVFEIEPYPAGAPLRAFPSCIFGSHNASNTKEAVRRTNETAFAKLIALLAP